MASPQVFWPYLAWIACLIAAAVTAGREFRRSRGFDKARTLGRLALAIPMAVFGTEHLASPHSIMRGVPAWMPAKLFWTYFVGIALIAAALSIIFRIAPRLSAALLGIMLLCFVAMIHLPDAIASPHNRIFWTIVARDSSFGAGAILLAAAGRAGGRRSAGWDHSLATGAVYLIAAVAIFFGIENLLHPECVPAVPLAKIVPAWIPMARVWTIITGIGLVAAGVAMFVKRCSRQAAAGLGAWVLLLVWSLYLAILISQRDIEGLNYFADTMVYAGVLLIASRSA